MRNKFWEKQYTIEKVVEETLHYGISIWMDFKLQNKLHMQIYTTN